MDLESLVKELSRNSNALKKMEEAVDCLVQANDLSGILPYQFSDNPTVFFYITKVLELRTKRKALTLDLSEEIEFTTLLIDRNPTYQLMDVYSLLGLYCWPFKMPYFFDKILSKLNSSVGYQILLLFLEKVNASSDIDDKRRNELKKAVSLLSNEIFRNFQESFAEFIIPIYTELLRIIPKDFDFSIVFRKAKDYPESAIEFFIEANLFYDANLMIDVLEHLPEDVGIIQILSSLKVKSIQHSEKVFQYVFRCLSSNPECLAPALEFWQKIFSSSNFGPMVEPVIIEVVKAFLSIDEETREEVDSFVFGFLTITAKNYPAECTAFMIKHADAIPTRISSNLLQKISRNQECLVYLQGLNFQNSYLNCLVNFLRNDPQTPSLIFNLNFADKEAVRLALQILAKYDYTQDQLKTIISQCNSGQLSSNEVKVECLIKLGIDFSFEGEWDMNKVIMYYYFLKKDRVKYSQYKESYYSLFVQLAPFDRCFSILEKIGNVPTYILEHIYNNMDKYPIIDVCCFNNDLLPYLPIIKPFVEKEVYRFISEWPTLVEYKEYYQSLKSLLPIFNSKIYFDDLIDQLINLIQIDCSTILNKLIPIFNSYKGKYNTRKAVYFFISAYNSPNLNDSQALVSAALTECLYQDDGAESFSEVLGLDMKKCYDAKVQISKCNRRTAQNLVRNLLKDFKGKVFSRLFENDIKVTKQDFLIQNKPIEDGDGPQLTLF